MTEPQKPEPLTITEWLGRISNADPHDIPPGAMVVQDNIQCLVPGELRVRRGVVKDADYTPSSPAAYTLISLFGYNVPDTDWMIGADTNGTVKARRSSGATTSLGTGKSGFWPWSGEKSRQGDAVLINGMDRGMIWNGLSGNSSPYELGIDAPAAAPTVALDAGQTPPAGSTAGTYVCGYRYVDTNGPVDKYSSLSALKTITSTADLDGFDWSEMPASSQSRVTHKELWRSASNATGVLYYVTRVTNATTVYADDNDSDTTMISAAVADLSQKLSMYDNNNSPVARKHGVPPNWKSCVKSFQDRFWYGADVVYDTGTVTTAGSTTIEGSGTAWTSAMVDRYIWIDTEPKPLKIATYTDADTVVTSTAATTSTAGLSYAITSDPGEWNKVIYSEPDLPESIACSGPTSTTATIVNTVTVQENTDDDDKIVGMMPFGSVLYVLKQRHIYSLTFARQPNIDANPRLISHRGALNARCYDIHEGTAYLMDEAGPWKMGMDGSVTPISGPLQDLFRSDSTTLDFTKRKWFHVACDPRSELVYFFVVYTGDTYPENALVYNARTPQWWTESYFDAHADSAKGLSSGAIVVYLAGEKDAVFELSGADTDYVSSQTRDAVTSSTATVVTDSGASFTDAIIGAPVGIEAGTGKGQLREISARTGTTFTVSSAWTTTPDSTSTYRIGAIQWSAKTGRMPLIEHDEQVERSATVVFQPTSGVNQLELQRFYNHDTTAANYPSPEAVNEGSNTLMANSQDDPYAIAPMQSARVSTSTHPGFCKTRFDGRVGDGQSVRWVQLELGGFKGDDNVRLFQMDVSGVG